MKNWLQYLIIVSLSVGLIAISLKKCKPEYKDKLVLVDSSEIKKLRLELAKYDRLSDRWAKSDLIQKDSIILLNKRSQTSKIKFITQYIKIKNDSIVVDSNCLITLELANQALLNYDKELNLASRLLDSCSFRSAKKDETIKVLREILASPSEKTALINELAKFRHVFWRWYWKKKRLP